MKGMYVLFSCKSRSQEVFLKDPNLGDSYNMILEKRIVYCILYTCTTLPWQTWYRVHT